MTETKRQVQKKLTRKHLIETAIKEYSEKGFLKTKTADIAEAANVSHGTLFVHFPTQEELFIAVIEEFGSRISSRLHELASTDSNLIEVLKAHLAGLTEYEKFYTNLIIERRLLPEEVSSTYILIQSTISFHISIAAEKEIKHGNIRNIPIHLIYNNWVGLIHYYLTNSDLFSPDSSVLKRYGDELINYYINLIKI